LDSVERPRMSCFEMRASCRSAFTSMTSGPAQEIQHSESLPKRVYFRFSLCLESFSGWDNVHSPSMEFVPFVFGPIHGGADVADDS
jgi:hypothetical protein